MKTAQAHQEISEAYRLADELDDMADKMDTVSPLDLG
jgi:predicted ribonuclease toxin of YeeF-YezG toxin-antitoxin module